MRNKNLQKLLPSETLVSRAPTRIDLAGGTIDIWPLYLFLKNPLTLNLGIDLFAEARVQIQPSSKGQAILRSDDQKTEVRYQWSDLRRFLMRPESTELSYPASLELHTKLLLFFLEKKIPFDFSDLNFDLILSTQAKSPAGAGLGGSSTLSIAIIGALSKWVSLLTGARELDPETDGENYIEIVRDVETTVIGVPAGLQDYYGAMFGGLQSLRWGPGIHERKVLPETLIPELEKRLLLFYSGHSRNSGINNWALFKGFIDQDLQIRTRFEEICRATHQLEEALLRQDWKAAGRAIGSEWQARRTLANGITTPEIDSAFTEAQKIAPVVGKVCGAGGGGCFFVFLPDGEESIRSEIRSIFAAQGLRHLPFRGVPRGVDVQVVRA